MGKVRVGVLAVTCTTCEDQVCCKDPWLCVYSVFYFKELIACVSNRRSFEPGYPFVAQAKLVENSSYLLQPFAVSPYLYTQ